MNQQYKILYHLFLGVMVVGILFIGCDKETDSPLIVKEQLSGLVQKGPYISGTQILMSELDNELNQTGRI